MYNYCPYCMMNRQHIVPYYSEFSINPMFNPNMNFENSPFVTEQNFQNKEPKFTQKYLVLNNLLRKLWFEHVMFTKLVIEAVLKDQENVNLLVTRLVRNSSDFENTFSKFYDTKISKKFGELLKEHIVLVGDYIGAYKSQDFANIDNAEKKMYENSEEIATFLSQINPNINKNMMLEMFNSHLDLIKKEVEYIYANRYLDAINLFDQISIQALEMADTFTNAIHSQFYNKF